MSEPVSLPASDAVIRSGDVTFVERQLAGNPAMASARIVDERGVSRTLLHVVADWPGSSDDVVLLDALLDFGADIEARGAVLLVAPQCPVRWCLPSGAPHDGCSNVVRPRRSAMDVAQESTVHALVELLCSHTAANTAFRS